MQKKLLAIKKLYIATIKSAWHDIVEGHIVAKMKDAFNLSGPIAT